MSGAADLPIDHLVPVEDAQPGVRPTGAPAEPRGERGSDDRLHIAHQRDQRERGEQDGTARDEESRRTARPAAPERAADELDRPGSAECAADRSSQRLGRSEENEPETRPGRGAEEERHGEPESSRAERPREEHSQRDPEPGGEADRVPAAHAALV